PVRFDGAETPLWVAVFTGATGMVCGCVERGTSLLCRRAALLSLRTAGRSSRFLAISGGTGTAMFLPFQLTALSLVSVRTSTLAMKTRTSKVLKMASAALAIEICFDRRWLGS